MSNPTPTNERTPVVRLNHDAAAYASNVATGKNLTLGEAVNDLVALGYATLRGDTEMVKILVRHIHEAGALRAASDKLRSMPPPSIPAGLKTSGSTKTSPPRPPAPPAPRKAAAFPTASGKPLNSVRTSKAAK